MAEDLVFNPILVQIQAMPHKKMSTYLIINRYQDFPLGVNLWGDILGKIAKNCMTVKKSRFLGQNHRGHEGEQAIF